MGERAVAPPSNRPGNGLDAPWLYLTRLTSTDRRGDLRQPAQLSPKAPQSKVAKLLHTTLQKHGEGEQQCHACRRWGDLSRCTGMPRTPNPHPPPRPPYLFHRAEAGHREEGEGGEGEGREGEHFKQGERDRIKAHGGEGGGTRRGIEGDDGHGCRG